MHSPADLYKNQCRPVDRLHPGNTTEENIVKNQALQHLVTAHIETLRNAGVNNGDKIILRASLCEKTAAAFIALSGIWGCRRTGKSADVDYTSNISRKDCNAGLYLPR